MRSKLNVILVLTLVAVCSNCDSGDTFAPATPSVLPTVTGDLTYQDDLVRKSTGGKAGFSGNPATNNGDTCSKCHNGGSIPAVTLNGPTTVASGSTNTYTLQITGEQIPAGGLDVSVTEGTLAAPESGTKIEKGEVVQTTARLVDSTGAISWAFDWTAPIVQADTTLTMYGAGASIDLDGGKSGDGTGTAVLLITTQLGGGQPQPPVANANGPYVGTVGVPNQFDSKGSLDPDGHIVTYSWDFGDDSTGTGATPTHAYNLAGSYTVTLTVTDNDSLHAKDITTAEIAEAATATPRVKQLRVPRKVGVTAARAPTKTLTVTAVFTGVPDGEPLCGTVFLDRNGRPYQNKPICFTIDKSRATVKFIHEFTILDAPSVEWLAHVKVNGVESPPVTGTTKVNVR